MWIPHPNNPNEVLYAMPGGTYILLRQLKGNRWQVIFGDFSLIYNSRSWMTARSDALRAIEQWLRRCVVHLNQSIPKPKITKE